MQATDILYGQNIGFMALFINAQLYGLMVAWCMTDGIIAGSKQIDSFCGNIVKPALMPYKK